MDKNKLNAILRKLNAYRRDPELVREPTLDEMATLIFFFVDQINSFEEAIKSGKLDGYTPQPGKDYPTKAEMTKMLTQLVNEELQRLRKSTDEQAKTVQAALNKIRQPKDGKDAVVTQKMMGEIASIAASLVKTPDVQQAAETAITASPEAIRNALELLQEDDRLSMDAIRGLREGLSEVREMSLKASNNRGTRGNPYIQQIQGLYIQDTEPVNAKLNDLWIDTSS